MADETFWTREHDILIPAALEGQITAERAAALSCKLVLEGANGPTLPEADDILQARGVVVVPDVIANAGGVTVLIIMVQIVQSLFGWLSKKIDKRLDTIMQSALETVWNKAQTLNITLRTAAYAVACERILLARKDRGLYP